MLANPAFKPLLLASIAVLILGLSFLVYKWPKGIHATFSRHAAAQKVTIWYYILLFAIALPLLFSFFAFWFVPFLNLSLWFLVVVGISQLLQHIVTLIPEIGGWKSKCHGLFTAISALLLIPSLVLLLMSPSIHKLSRAIVVTSLLVMLGIIAYQLMRSKYQQPKYLLILQAGYYGAFFIAILASAYIV